MLLRVSRYHVFIREPAHFVLASLQDGPLHGYGIIRRAAELSGGRVRLATGTLYTALDRLTGEGYVSLVSENTVAGRVRRAYRLTGAGLAALRAEAERMEYASQLVSAASRRAAVGSIVVVGGRVRLVSSKARTHGLDGNESGPNMQ
jgi:PadR family transcriptional regulator, regulatory protein PadR